MLAKYWVISQNCFFTATKYTIYNFKYNLIQGGKQNGNSSQQILLIQI